MPILKPEGGTVSGSGPRSSGAKVLVRRGDIEGHQRPPGGDFSQRAVIPSALTRLAVPFLGVHCVDTSEPVIALTYDDGPHPEHTPGILDALAAHQARATFFVMTPAARAHPAIVRRILDEGHCIGLHGPDHRSLLSLGTREAVGAVARARDELQQLAGTAVRLYRPPYGHHTLRQARAIRRLGLELVLWSSHGLDWIDRPVQDIVQDLAESVFPGAVLLLHDDRADPEQLADGEALPRFDKALVTHRLLERLAERDLVVRPVEDLLARYPHVLSGSRERMRRR